MNGAHIPFVGRETRRGELRYASKGTAPLRGGVLVEDALDPNVLRARVEAAIREYVDWPAWERCALAEEAERRSLVDVLGAWKAAAG